MTGIGVGISIGEGSFGGGGAGAGIDVPEASDSVDGGSGGSIYETDDTRRLLLEVLEEPLTEGWGGSSRDMLMSIVL